MSSSNIGRGETAGAGVGVGVGTVRTGSATGVALNTSLWWVWLAWMAFVAACHVQVQIEEAHLRASFGDAYCDFASSTPRWIGIAR